MLEDILDAVLIPFVVALLFAPAWISVVTV